MTLRTRFFFGLLTACLVSGTAHAHWGPPAAYEKRSDGVYYNFEKVDGIDATSFHVLSEPYAADSSHVYLAGEVIIGADPGTFSLLSQNYARDALHVYYLGEIVELADPKSFTVAKSQEPTLFFADNAHVYIQGKIVKGADPATFSPFRDTLKCHATAPWLGNDPNAFSPPGDTSCPGNVLGRDAAHVFYRTSQIENAMPADVKLIPTQYFKNTSQYWVSGHNIFFKDKPLQSADPATFEAYYNPVSGNEINGDAFTAEDKGHYFLGADAVDRSRCASDPGCSRRAPPR